MDTTSVLKAIADETRMKILILLLRHNHCVRALARNLKLSEATVSQHLKVLREAGLLSGEKRGYFMHYDVRRAVLRDLAGEIEALAATPRETCTPEMGGCQPSERANCHAQGGDAPNALCRGGHHGGHHDEEGRPHGHCHCHQS